MRVFIFLVISRYTERNDIAKPNTGAPSGEKTVALRAVRRYTPRALWTDNGRWRRRDRSRGSDHLVFSPYRDIVRTVRFGKRAISIITIKYRATRTERIVWCLRVRTVPTDPLFNRITYAIDSSIDATG